MGRSAAGAAHPGVRLAAARQTPAQAGGAVAAGVGAGVAGAGACLRPIRGGRPGSAAGAAALAGGEPGDGLPDRGGLRGRPWLRCSDGAQLCGLGVSRRPGFGLSHGHGGAALLDFGGRAGGGAGPQPRLATGRCPRQRRQRKHQRCQRRIRWCNGLGCCLGGEPGPGGHCRADWRRAAGRAALAHRRTGGWRCQCG